MKKQNNNMTRRDFIKTSSAGLAGAAILASPLGPLAGKALAATPPDLAVEKGATLNVLRWSIHGQVATRCKDKTLFSCPFHTLHGMVLTIFRASHEQDHGKFQVASK